MQQDIAEAYALHALAWLVADDDLRDVFMGASGVDQDALKAGATDPVFLGSLLDFILMDDAWVIGVAKEIGVAPDAIAKIRSSLPGGDLPHWT